MAYNDPTNVGNTPGMGPLRAGGVAVSALPDGQGHLPSTLSPAAKAQVQSTTLMRDVVRGTPKIRSRSTVYLPKAPGEDPQNYGIRLERSVFFNVTGRTIDGLVGQVFQKDPVLSDDVPAPIKEAWENIDLAGTHGDVFVRDLLEDSLTAGHAAILVEFPATGGAQNAQQEQRIRPYWVPIQKENILSWRTTVEDGHTVLTQLVLRECQSVADGAFGEKEQVRYRVFTRDAGVVLFRLLEITKDNQVIVVDEGPYPTQTEIPVAEIVTSGRAGIFESRPPLEDLAALNIAFYQMWSDYATSIHKTCVPIFFLAGVEDVTEGGQKSALVLGPNTAITTSNPLAKAAYIAHDGAALGSVEKALDGLKADMGTLGIAMLAPQKRSAETATAHRQDKSTEDSALAVTARGLQDGIERALGFHAKYLKLPSGGSITINRVFDTAGMDAAMLTAWTNATTAGLPARYQLGAMQNAELIPADEDVESIADEMAANAQAKADTEQQRQADLLAMKQPPVKAPPLAA